MRITQGTFSYLDDLTDEQIAAQVQYGLDQGWAPQVEHTDDPHPRNFLWHMWGLPMFELTDGQPVVDAVNACREAHPQDYIRVTIYDSSRGRQTTGLQFIVNRPEYEPGFRLERQEGPDRVIRYTLQSYAAQAPHGQRYGNGQRPSS